MLHLRTDNESMDELRHKFLCIKFELESTRKQFLEEKAKGEETMKQLLGHLEIALRERDQARGQLQKLQTALLPTLSRQNTKATEAYNSQSKSSQVISFTSGHQSSLETLSSRMVNQHLNGYDYASLKIEHIAMGKPLPEKGKLLQTVMEAGPLLDTLLIAGPVPKWRNPPPQLQALQKASSPTERSPTGLISLASASSLKLSLGVHKKSSNSLLCLGRGTSPCLNRDNDLFRSSEVRFVDAKGRKSF